MTDNFLEKTLDAPQLSLYYEQIGAVLQAERAKHQPFYATIQPHDKAEFVNGEISAALFTPEQVTFPAPDFVVEILSPGTETLDRTTKYTDYAAHRLAEYWMIDAEAQTVEQYLLQGERYYLQTRSRTGLVSSSAVPGFEIPIPAIFDSAEHTAALQRLRA